MAYVCVRERTRVCEQFVKVIINITSDFMVTSDSINTLRDGGSRSGAAVFIFLLVGK